MEFNDGWPKMRNHSAVTSTYIYVRQNKCCTYQNLAPINQNVPFLLFNDSYVIMDIF